MTSPTETREAVARTDQTLRAQVRDCIGDGVSPCGQWVNAIMERVVGPLHAEVERLRAHLESFMPPPNDRHKPRHTKNGLPLKWDTDSSTYETPQQVFDRGYALGYAQHKSDLINKGG